MRNLRPFIQLKILLHIGRDGKIVYTEWVTTCDSRQHGVVDVLARMGRTRRC